MDNIFYIKNKFLRNTLALLLSIGTTGVIFNW